MLINSWDCDFYSVGWLIITFQYQGADTVKNDGIYSRYFTDYHGNGRYSLKVFAQARKSTARLSSRQQQNKALYIPGYVENGK